MDYLWGIKGAEVAHKAKRLATTTIILAVGVLGVALSPRAEAAPQGPWELPATSISEPSVAVGPAQVAVGPDGTTTAVWNRSDLAAGVDVIQASTRPPKGPWSDPVDLTESGVADNPQIVVGPNGATTVVWERDPGPGEFSRIESITRPPGDAFPQAGQVHLISALDANAYAPQIAVGGDGKMVVVWERTPVGSPNGLIRYRNFAADGTPGDFTGGLSATGNDADTPQVAIGPGGVVTAVWVRADDNGDDIVQVSTRPDDNSAFGPDVDLSEVAQDAQDPKIAVGPDGAAVVVWWDTSANRVYASVREPALEFPSPGEATLLSSDFAGLPDITFGADGTAYVAWSEFASSIARIRMTSKPQGEGFPPPAEGTWISDENENAYFAEIVAAPDSTLTVVWNVVLGGANGFARAATRPVGGSFPAEPEKLSEHSTNGPIPQVVVAPSGVATAVWTRDDGNGMSVESTSTTIPAYNLQVTRQGTGAGTVTSSPVGINCGNDCVEGFEHGSQVTLSAVPAAGSKFSGWGGPCAGSSLSCVVTMDQALTVGATFELSNEKPTPPPGWTAVFDGKSLHVRMLCPGRFKPRCFSKAVPVTSKKVKKVEGKKRPAGKPIATIKTVKTLSGKWRKVTFLIKPQFRKKVQGMVGTGKRTLHVRQTIRSKRIKALKNRRTSLVFHSYKVRAG